ncbi:glycosyltransferase [Hyphococcus luteus]|uniref:Glycosyl transferase family 1 n=1 Tax=Hyphococcus luteus TaxID=2058213 RepID=A0A2S7JZQ6_9PROT|nr:glycosyltransferase [Marinicaulis flavus]PQA85745.1 glycosyl transferase family 1 [Marinicaulis flavus]
MRILFLHDNFPAQFGALGKYLVHEGWEVWFGTQRKGASFPGFNVFTYSPHRAVTKSVHPYAANYERAVLAGQAAARAGLALKKKGFMPDIVMAHSGWGPGLFVKDIWPDTAYIGYFEWYYSAQAPDVAYLAGTGRDADDDLRARARNAAILMDLAHCDGAVCPTEFQKAQFPSCFQEKLEVFHDGIDTDYYRPASGVRLRLGALDLSHTDKVITYVARGMEPYRGFPAFMKALERVLKEEPEAHAVIVGEDRVAYGKQLPAGESYKQKALKDCNLDWERVHFTGLLSRGDYLKVLQSSAVHAYLTIPFVLSWSMMEAMSAGCALVASNVAPVREVLSEGEALLVDHRNTNKIADEIIGLLRSPELRARLGANARKKILEGYAAKTLYLLKRDWLEKMAASASPGRAKKFH